MATHFNFEEAQKQLQSGKKLTDTDGVLTPLIKQLTEAALQAELDTSYLRVMRFMQQSFRNDYSVSINFSSANVTNSSNVLTVTPS